MIKKSPLYNILSEQGKRIYLPQGVFHWSGRAKKEAEIMGTLGSAFGFEEDFIEGGAPEWVPLYLEDIKKYTKFNVNEIVPYPQISGLEDLKNSWKNWIIKKSCYNIDFEQDKLNKLENFVTTPVVTAGLTNGIFLCCSLLLNQGDFIISPNKRWGNYDNIVEILIGARIKSFDFFSGENFNVNGMKNAIYEISKVQEKIILILGFPNNPTGYVPNQEELEEILDALIEAQKTISKPIIIIVDDAYEPYVYSKEVINRSIFYALHELEEDIIPIKLDGITKELLLYGGRIGFITIGLKPHWVKNAQELTTLKAEIDNKLSGLLRTTISNSNHFYQSLTLKLFDDIGMDGLIQKREKVKHLLKERYEKINAEFKKIKNENISVDSNAGGFFIFVNLNPEVIKANDFADHLLKKYKVGVIPIEKQHDNINGIRIAYCSIDLRKIPEFVSRIGQALRDF
ncbi:MAG TPA: aminotransferase class I/II-fold pyridoxal phosphate-dependent enzyme [Candidatus Nanopelagicaceae bacterium]|nr:aminotransferase class I/II-fold pyridoxal phosphate-dependent enzyme [Candidatus Nanopelagicaceae bacterium]